MHSFAQFLKTRIFQAFGKLLPTKSKLSCTPSRLLAPFPKVSGGQLDDNMDIRRQQFGACIVSFLQDAADSHFIAFDLEFSGIPERSRDRPSKPSLQENYTDLRQAVQKYQILQIGLTLIKFDGLEGQYIAQPYNFTISPLPDLRERQFRRDWSMNSGAISFLQRHGFDFGAWITHGIHYLSREEEDLARARMTAEATRQDMVWKPEDEPLVVHIRKSIAKWQAQPKSEQEEYLNIPDGTAPGLPDELNRYQMRLTHQIVQNEYPGLVTRGMAHFVQITNPDEIQQASQKRIEAEQRERDLSKAIGFRWILEGIAGNDISKLPDDFVIAALGSNISAAEGDTPIRNLLHDLGKRLRERRKILIGHNCLTDLMYLYRMIIGELPDHIHEFCDNLHELFPAIVDTKFLASSFSDRYGRNTLGDVELDLRCETVPSITSSVEFDRYQESAYYHEAGYDSFLTAIVAIKLSAKLFKDGPKRKESHQKQEQKVAQVAASSHTEFGIEEGYITAAESIDSTVSPTDLRVEKVPEVTHAPTNCSPSTEISTPTPKPATVVAVIENVVEGLPHDSKHPKRNDDSTVDHLRSIFASTSIYDKLGSDGEKTKMPGDEEPKEESTQQTIKKSKAVNMNKLVKNGEMMPRWHEEGSFWEVYGNKLQVNGTKEGVLKLTG